MPDWRETLNLPKTKFPMKANLAQREPDILRRWYEEGLYRRCLKWAVDGLASPSMMALPMLTATFIWARP